MNSQRTHCYVEAKYKYILIFYVKKSKIQKTTRTCQSFTLHAKFIYVQDNLCEKPSIFRNSVIYTTLK